MKPGQTVTTLSAPWLVIKSGPQAGCSLALQTGALCVGKSLDNDAVIADMALADKHFKIQKTFFGIKLVALEGSLQLPSGKVLTKNSSFLSRKSLEFSAGNTNFELVVPKRINARTYGLAGILVVLLGFAYLSSVFPRHSSRPTSPLPSVSSAQQGDGNAAHSMQHALQEKLAAQHLSAVRVSATTDGAVIASGSAQPEQRALWSATKLWFDETYGTHALLLDHVSFTHVATRSPVQIAAVALGAAPYVIDMSGQRLPPGSVVEDGWIIDQILPDSILLHRGSEHLTVHF
ncbi:hypothetical protein GOB82_07430 [Acetobacter farinalis]|nr:hypothetical protein [Acetobacter farinalis]